MATNTETLGRLEMMMGEQARSVLDGIATVPDVDILHDPMEIYRAHLADCFIKILGCDARVALDAIQISSDITNGDFDVVLPRLKLKSPPWPGKPQEQGSELITQFVPSPLFTVPILDGIHVRFFLSRKTAPCLLLPFISDYGTSYGSSPQFGLRDPSDPKSGRKKLLIEFASPNLTTQSHSAHLRSAIIGSHLAALHENMGWDVTRINYLGEWGLQVGLLMAGWTRFGDDEAFATNALAALIDVYTRIEAEFRPELDARARIRTEGGDQAEAETRQAAIETQGLHAERDAWFTKLEDGDEKAVALWQRFRDASVEQYRHIYSRLGVVFDEYTGESQVSASSIAKVEEVLKEKELYKEVDGGAIIDYGTKRLGKGTLRFRTGTSTYLLREIAGVLDRAEKYSFDKMIYVVSAEQDTHFQRLFKTLELMGHSDLVGKLQHVHFGKAHELPLEDDDDTHLLSNILDQSLGATNELLKVDIEKGALLGDPDAAAGPVAASSLVVQDLHCKRDGPSSIDLVRATTFEGETGPSLQYWYARLCNVLRNAAGPATVDYSIVNDDDYGDLLPLLARFPDASKTAFKTLEPGGLLTYLFRLVDELSMCFEDEEVPEVTASDGIVYSAVRQVLENGMRVLGIPICNVW